MRPQLDACEWQNKQAVQTDAADSVASDKLTRQWFCIKNKLQYLQLAMKIRHFIRVYSFYA